jgi:hypothetical protein
MSRIDLVQHIIHIKDTRVDLLHLIINTKYIFTDHSTLYTFFEFYSKELTQKENGTKSECVSLMFIICCTRSTRVSLMFIIYYTKSTRVSLMFIICCTKSTPYLVYFVINTMETYVDLLHNIINIKDAHVDLV